MREEKKTPGQAPLPHGIALAALECIRQAYEPGTMAHDTAHKALDDVEAARADPQPAPGLAAAETKLRDSIRRLLADLYESAAATRPSRKSEIEDKLAAQLRQLLETP